MSWQALVEETVRGLGYELVACERTTGGLLRVCIELAEDSRPVTVDDCERVTRQLQYALEVEAADYRRLEVSSPGLDRPLRKPADFERFIGARVAVTFKLPIVTPGATPAATPEPEGRPAVGAPRRRLTGRLEAAEPGRPGWRLVLDPEPEPERHRPRRSRAAAPHAAAEVAREQAVAFVFDEVRAAHLVPEIDFRGRRAPASGPEDASTLNKNGDRDK